MIVVDASALVAIARREPERDICLRTLVDADVAFLSPMNYVEAGIVLSRDGLISSAAVMDRWLNQLAVRVNDMPVTQTAFDAYLRFGKGRHPARLNLGDCFAYALAKTLDAPLLYKGDDFALTDVRSAL